MGKHLGLLVLEVKMFLWKTSNLKQSNESLLLDCIVKKMSSKHWMWQINAINLFLLACLLLRFFNFLFSYSRLPFFKIKHPLFLYFIIYNIIFFINAFLFLFCFSLLFSCQLRSEENSSHGCWKGLNNCYVWPSNSFKKKLAGSNIHPKHCN